MRENIMEKSRIITIIILALAALPVTLLASTHSQEVAFENTVAINVESMDVTIYQRNPLLGNRHVMFVGYFFSSFQGTIDGSFSIYDKSTGLTTEYSFFVDASSPYMSDAYDTVELVLPPGEYTIYFDPDARLNYKLYTRGWLADLTTSPDNVNIFQFLMAFLALVPFLIVLVALLKRDGIVLLRR
jgi:hypothetical protein